jgi:hypothetical protein
MEKKYQRVSFNTDLNLQAPVKSEIGEQMQQRDEEIFISYSWDDG